MFNRTTDSTLRTGVLTSLSAALALSASALAGNLHAQAAREDRPSGARGTAGSSSEGTGEHSSHYSISEDGLQVEIKTTTRTRRDSAGGAVIDERREVTAFLDGRPVPKERIREHPDRVEILDEQGEVIRSIALSRIHTAARAGAQTARELAVRERADALSARAATEGPRVRMGVALDNADPALARQLRLPADQITVLSAITPDGPAAKAGLQAFDVVIAVEGNPPASPERLRNVLRGKQPGQALRLTLVDGQETRDVEIILEERTDDRRTTGAGALAWTLDGLPFGPIVADADVLAALEAFKAGGGAIAADVQARIEELLARQDVKEVTSRLRQLEELYAKHAAGGGGAGATFNLTPRFFAAPRSAESEEFAFRLEQEERIQRLERIMERLEQSMRRIEERLDKAAPPQPNRPRA